MMMMESAPFGGRGFAFLCLRSSAGNILQLRIHLRIVDYMR